MKIVLLVLSGSENRARARARADHPGAEIVPIQREQFRRLSVSAARKEVRALAPDLFRVHCRELSSQPRINLLLAFGLLAGARWTEIIDETGNRRSCAWLSALFRVFPSLAIEAVAAAVLVAASWLAAARLKRRLAAEPRAKCDSDFSSKRILYLLGTPLSLSAAGGARAHVEGFLSGAEKLGWQITLVTIDDLGPAIASLCDQVVAGPSRFFNSLRDVLDLANHWRIFSSARSAAKHHSCAFIYQRYSRLNWAGVILARALKKRLVLEFNGSEVWIARHWDSASLWKLLALGEDLALSGADRIAVTSEADRANLLARGADSARVFVNQNGVDPDVFRPDCGGKQLRRQRGIDREIVIGYIGSFGPWHGAEVLAHVGVELSRREGFRFLFIGDGVFKPRAERIVLEGSAECFVTFTGPVSHHEVPRYLDACDILASPHVPNPDGTEFFGSPTKLFEYLAMGKAIVASRLGQIGEIVRHGENGLLVAPGSVEELAAAVRQLSDDPELRTRLGARARADAIERWSWERNAKKVIEAASQ